MRHIAHRISQLNGEGALAVFSRAKELERQGLSIIHLELGEPDFHPVAPVVDAVCEAVAGGATATYRRAESHHYAKRSRNT
jgi:aspartate/methionine/tyrosine aminotransferase